MEKIEGIKSGGFQISMEDMKIRGAGEILGDKQHGTIETFGYDLYIKMLNEEIKRQKGEFREKIENVEILLREKGYIPETYIQKEERLNIYKRFAMLEKFEELNEMKNEIEDRFGKIPNSMKKFILSIELKLFAEQNHIQRIDENSDYYELYFLKNIPEEKINKLSENLDWKDISNEKKTEEYIVKRLKKIKLKDYISKISKIKC